VTLPSGKTLTVEHPYLHMRAKPEKQTGNRWFLTEEESQKIAERIEKFSPKTVIDPLEQPLEFPVYSLDRSSRDPINLDKHVFGLTARVDIIHRSVKRYMASQRQGTHSEKRRDEVRGGGRKPRPQKGQGVSRQGSIRSPQWRGGGVVFPRKTHDYSFLLTNKVETLALKMTLSSKVESGHFVIVDNFESLGTKPRELMQIEEQWGWKKPLYVTEGSELPKNLVLSSGRSKGGVALQKDIHPHKLLLSDFVVIERAAVAALEERLLKAH